MRICTHVESFLFWRIGVQVFGLPVIRRPCCEIPVTALPRSEKTSKKNIMKTRYLHPLFLWTGRVLGIQPKNECVEIVVFPPLYSYVAGPHPKSILKKWPRTPVFYVWFSVILGHLPSMRTTRTMVLDLVVRSASINDPPLVDCLPPYISCSPLHLTPAKRFLFLLEWTTPSETRMLNPLTNLVGHLRHSVVCFDGWKCITLWGFPECWWGDIWDRALSNPVKRWEMHFLMFWRMFWGRHFFSFKIFKGF